MTLFEFVSVMFSIILGLSLSHTLSGLASLVRTRNVVTTFGPQGIWTTTLVLMHFLLWWSIWDFRAVSWNFPRFVVASAEPLILFFMTALLLPSVSGGDDVDLESHFFRIRRLLMGLFAVLMIIFLVDGPWVFQTEAAWSWYRLPQVIGLLAVLYGLRADGRRSQWAVATIVLAVILSGTGFRFLPAAFTSTG
ncbi:MAG: hypothetical protein KJO06_08500 [Gemmatimonadetes bacterium]|nr:hypothetical protein [Gemmatimonadota bacterium]NNF37746.1 hypothetical protein [Gemmatimonadota bacterium]